MIINVQDIAASTLEKMQSVGFDNAQVSVSVSEQDELNISNNEPSLLRSTEDYALSLTGMVDGRKAGAALTDLDGDAIAFNVNDLYQRALLAPQDEANAVSSGESARFEQGPQFCDLDLLAKKVEELLAFRKSETPKMAIDEGAASHQLTQEHILTSGGSSLSCSVGRYELSAFGTATDGEHSSSFNYAGGATNDLSLVHASEYFGIGDMLRDTQNQIKTFPIDKKFTGAVILAPTAVTDLLSWLLGQIGDMALISGGSVFKDSVGSLIASPMLNICSRFDAPGHATYSNDAFRTPPIKLVSEGKLGMLLPSFYGSKKTSTTHTPAGSGWSVSPGKTSRAALIANTGKGALVTRLSMGSPGANGDFSGVIKNSFIIKDGEVGPALSESMITGNMAEMLKDIDGLSEEHLDLGSMDLPWIRIPNLHFS